MIVTTSNDLDGYEVTEYLGIVRGIVVRTMGFSRALAGGLKAFSGGNNPEFTAVCEEARNDAFNIMLEHASALGADAVIAMRYDATQFLEGSTEVLAYGTAVKCRRSSGSHSPG